MKKRFWTRLISAVLTMAMAFSILAVPASAASEGDSWTVGMDNRDGGKIWITEEYVRQSLKEQDPTMSDGQLEEMLEVAKNSAQEEWGGEKIPDRAILGITLADATVTYWFDSESDFKHFYELLEAGTQINGYKGGVKGGVVIFEDGTEIGVVGYAGTPVVGDDTTPDPDDSTETTEPDNPVVTPEPDEEETKVGFFNPFNSQQEAPYEWEICTTKEVKEMALQMVAMTDSSDGLAIMEAAGLNVELFESKKDQIQTMEDEDLIDFANEVGVPVVEAPDAAVVGISASKDGKVYWYTEEQVEKINDAMEAAGETGEWENGVFTIRGETFNPMNPDDSTVTPDPDDSTGTTEPDNPVVTPDPDEKVDWNWALVTEDESVEGYVWTPAIVFAQQFAQQMGIELSDITAAQMEEIKKAAATRGDVEPITYDEEAYLGFSNTKEEAPSWFTEEAMAEIFEADEAEPSDKVLARDENGNLVLKDSDGTVLATAKPIGSAEEPKPEPEPEPEPSEKVVAAAVGIPVDSGEADFSELFSGMIAWYPVEAEELTDEMRAAVEQRGWTIRENIELSTEMDFGLSQSAEGKIFWYNEEMLESIADDWEADEEPVSVEIDEKAGAIIFVSNKGNRAELTTDIETPGVNEATPSKPTETKPAAGGSSSDGTAVVLAAVGAAAAATGVYLYTHPEKVEAIKDFFADLSANVQAKVQQLATNVKGAFGIIIPDREDDEEEEPVAAAVEEAQAA